MVPYCLTMLHWIELLVGLFMIGATFVDTFCTILLPRTVRRSSRITSKYFRITWRYFSRFSAKSKTPHSVNAVFGPLSLLGLFLVWTVLLILGFALVFHGSLAASASGPLSFGDSLYFSGVTFFTLGFGDITLATPVGKFLSVAEAGTGFAFLAVVISYLPVIYGSFSRRELLITLMDARAGSPPSGGEMVRRFAVEGDLDGLADWLARWETWAGEFLESHLSYPALVFYRSQHWDTSWLTAITAVMDACSIIKVACVKDSDEQRRLKRQAGLTFAMCRHALIDLAQVLNNQTLPSTRLNSEQLQALKEVLSSAGFTVSDQGLAELSEMRSHYEPIAEGLAWALDLNLPAWTKDPAELDNWQTRFGDETHL